MEAQDLKDAGFKVTDDPQFKFEYSLANNDNEGEDLDNPALLYDSIMSQFCVTDGNVMFIYFNADTPSEAVKWANKITNFELN